MQESIVYLLRCPLSGKKLSLEIIKKFRHPLMQQTEVHSGFLWCSTGGCYPIINGLPRMLPDSFLQYEQELQQWWQEFALHKQRILNTYSKVIYASSINNKKIRSTFGFEWSLLKKSNNLKIWNLDAAGFKNQLMKELSLPPDYTCNLALDAGCGHGRSARNMAAFANIVIGAEVSPAAELAYEQNNEPRCHILQADIHYLPFASTEFDIVYSSGVLHHNASTKNALQKIAVLVKPGGIVCVWLYHTFKNILHKGMLALRCITKHLPVRAVYYINTVTLTPAQWCVSKIAGRQKKFTEISIEQLDMLTPEYRHEHTHDEVSNWLNELQFKKIEITDEDKYGFSIKGEKINTEKP